MISTRKKAALIFIACAWVVIAMICLLTKPFQSGTLFRSGEAVSPAVIDAGEFIPVDSNKLLADKKERLIEVKDFHANQLTTKEVCISTCRRATIPIQGKAFLFCMYRMAKVSLTTQIGQRVAEHACYRRQADFRKRRYRKSLLSVLIILGKRE